MGTVAIIPARGGSKGIPRKNLLPLCGKPLIGWTIEAARSARCVDRVVVSTDDAEIGAIARQLGAEIVWRPEEISGDQASSEAALLHALELLHQTEQYEPERVVFLQCTSPLTSYEDINGTVAALEAQQADSALAVTDFHYFLWRECGDGDVVGINHDKSVRQLRQQREPNYRETGAVYVVRTAGFRETKHRFFGKTAHYVMPAGRCWEIDEPVDLMIAEALLRQQLGERQLDQLPDPVGALVLDFDGVLTDNRALVLEDGREAVTCDRSDGLALSRLRQTGLPILVLSSEKNVVVARRCEKLGVPCLHGVARKWPVLHQWLKQRAILLHTVVYVGNDVNDLECLRAVGCPVAVGDAQPEAKSASRIVLAAPGGRGAVRELANLIAQKTQGRCHAASA